jgi:hypothetical protein
MADLKVKADDISEYVLDAHWAKHWLNQLDFTPVRIFSFKTNENINDTLVKFREVTRGKLGAYSVTSRSLVLFLENEDDAVLIKMFFE